MQGNFLPEDYIAQKAERRTNAICLSLFALVMFSIFGVFVLSSRQRSTVISVEKSYEAEIRLMADEIEKIKVLEEQRSEMIEKAEIAAALVERVPRSILLAEIVNRMPASMTLTDFDMKSKKIVAVQAAETATGAKGRKPKRPATRQEAAVATQSAKVEPPRYEVSLTIVGVAPDDRVVSEFVRELGASPLLHDVSLVYAESTELNKIGMREFKATMQVAENADVRNIEPLKRSRRRGPMGGTMFQQPVEPVTGSTSDAATKDGGRSWNPFHLLGGGRND